MSGVTITTLEDGRKTLQGRTFDHKEKIKAVGGIWDPAAKSWTVPAGADLSFLTPPPPPPPKVWTTYVRRDRNGRCCSRAQAKLDDYDPQGPLWYICDLHGNCRSNYTGD